MIITIFKQMATSAQLAYNKFELAVISLSLLDTLVGVNLLKLSLNLKSRESG